MNTRFRTQNRPSGSVHGVLIVDKPRGLTSHDVVSRVRRAFGTRRVGHAGTLDPLATGVLVLLLGEATKLSSVLTTEVKTYEALVQFGSSTDTLDADGSVTKKVALAPDWLDEGAVEVVLEQERQRSLQIPPQVSAIKVDGVRAYQRARQGQVTELTPRAVQVHRLVKIKTTAPDRQSGALGSNQILLHVRVSKGYYVRSLARDLGDALGVPAHLAGLRRIQSGPFTLEETCVWPIEMSSPLISIGDAAKRSLFAITVNSEGAERLNLGKKLTISHFEGSFPENLPPKIFAAFYQEGLLALVEPSPNDEFRVKRGVNDPLFVLADLPPSPTDS